MIVMSFKQAPSLPYDKLGIVEDGDTASQAITKGRYIIWKGKNYFSKTDITIGDTFDSTNMLAIEDGVINEIIVITKTIPLKKNQTIYTRNMANMLYHVNVYFEI